jgi:hypothetical protein
MSGSDDGPRQLRGANAVCNGILAAVSRFGGGNYEDDIALLAISVHEPDASLCSSSPGSETSTGATESTGGEEGPPRRGPSLIVRGLTP